MIKNPVAGMKVMPVRDAASWSTWFAREVIDKGMVLTIEHIDLDYMDVYFRERVTISGGHCWNRTSVRSLKEHYIEVNPCPMEVAI